MIEEFIDIEADINDDSNDIDADVNNSGHNIDGDLSIAGEDGKDGEKGEPGNSGVHIGNEPPTDDANVWIDLDAYPDDEVATKKYVNDMLGVIENGYY